MSPPMKDLTNQRFGTLIVLERDYDYAKNHGIKDQHVYWKCKCDCGREVTINGSLLRNGSSRTCGKGLCFPLANNLINKVFGQLLVLEPVGQAKDRHLKWRCLCTCGNETIVNSNELTTGHVTSCGCIKSKGELAIKTLLTQNNILFETEKTFSNCIYPSGAYPRFDFYINNDFLLEYDGIQHFEPSGGYFSKENFELQKKRDQFKTNWCKENNIILKRIPYTKLTTITIDDIMGDKYIDENKN